MMVQMELPRDLVADLRRHLELNDEITESEDAVEELEREIRELESQRDEKQEEIETLEQERDELASDLRETLADHFLSLSLSDIREMTPTPVPSVVHSFPTQEDITIGSRVVLLENNDYRGNTIFSITVGNHGIVEDRDTGDSTVRVRWTDSGSTVWHTTSQVRLA